MWDEMVVVAQNPALHWAVVAVAVPPFARLTVVLMLPVPLAVLQAEPDDAVHVQATPVSTLGMVSVTVAPVTGLGPSLVTVIV